MERSEHIRRFGRLERLFTARKEQKMVKLTNELALRAAQTTLLHGFSIRESATEENLPFVMVDNDQEIFLQIPAYVREVRNAALASKNKSYNCSVAISSNEVQSSLSISLADNSDPQAWQDYRFNKSFFVTRQKIPGRLYEWNSNMVTTPNNRFEHDLAIFPDESPPSVSLLGGSDEGIALLRDMLDAKIDHNATIEEFVRAQMNDEGEVFWTKDRSNDTFFQGLLDTLLPQMLVEA